VGTREPGDTTEASGTARGEAAQCVLLMSWHAVPPDRVAISRFALRLAGIISTNQPSFVTYELSAATGEWLHVLRPIPVDRVQIRRGLD
jgi:hypothetical protein